jgi:hypothetical protein
VQYETALTDVAAIDHVPALGLALADRHERFARAAPADSG